jgi:hypothetical protein
MKACGEVSVKIISTIRTGFGDLAGKTAPISFNTLANEGKTIRATNPLARTAALTEAKGVFRNG